MAIWVNADVLDFGLDRIKTACNSMAAIESYTAGDNYATVTGGNNILAQVAMASGDFTIASDGNDRKITTASGKQDTTANNTGPVSHIAFLDTANSKVLWVTNETSGQTINSGQPVNFPSLVYTSTQPVLDV